MIKTLVNIAKGFNEYNIVWAIGGSLVLESHGIVNQVNDIDLLIESKDIKKATKILDKMGTRKIVEKSPLFETTYFYKYVIDGIDVDVMSEFKIVEDLNIFDYTFNSKSIDKTVEIDNTKLFYTSLEDWYILYKKMKRNEKVELIKEYFNKTNKFMYNKKSKLYDKYGEEILLKGVGLGGWMLPEGYMWDCHKYYERPRRFEELVEIYYEEESFSFWDRYYKNWISDNDFRIIKEHGYNSVRLPMNFRLLMDENEIDSTVTFNEYGFKMIDYTIEECRKNNLYVILDLHGAPGGQTGTNIDDSKYDKPELFTNRIYQEQTITLWKEIARRYKNSETVCMYDLLNEPLPNWNKHLNKHLEPLHKEIVKAIRLEDPHHLISIEGAHWATDFSTITEKFDDKLVLHFHKYWSPPSVDTIQEFLNKREELELPLFMGEGGENDLYWYSSTFKMYDQLNISWNFWAYKKRNNHNSVVSYDTPEGWKEIFDKDNPLSKEKGRRLLEEFLLNISFENCNINKEVTNHLFYQDEFYTTGGLYDYYGEGNSFKVSTPNSNPIIRITDKTHICDRNGEEFIGAWGVHKKNEIQDEIYPFIKGNKDDFYKYSFNVLKKNVGTEMNIYIYHNNLELDVYINDNKVEIQKYNETEFLIRFIPENSKNILQLRPLNKGIIKYIVFKNKKTFLF